MLDGRQMGEERGEERQQRTVREHHAVGGVIDDPDELLGREPEIEGVEDRAHGGDREIRLDMFGVVPHQRGKTLVGADAEFIAQGVGEPCRALPDLGEAAALRLVPAGPGGDL